jgi:signal transduction histidine kinase
MELTNDLTVEKYKAIFQISNDLASSLDIDSILERITHHATELLNAEVASILLYDPNKEQLYFRSATNMKYHTGLSQILVQKESLAGWVAEHREPLIIDDAHEDGRFSDHVEKKLKYQTRNLCIVPMIVKTKLIGVLEVLNKRNTDFTAIDQDILSALGTQAAIAIENARLFHQSDTIADLVHELRTPLNAINTISYLLLRTELNNEQRNTFVSTIQAETNRLSELVSNFLDFSRLESGREQFIMESFDLHALCKECLNIVSIKAMDKHVTLHILDSNTSPIMAYADRNKIKQVLLNLLSNGIKYNKEYGTVDVILQEQTELISITVSDTGLGIAEKDLPELFHKYYRATDIHQSIQGTGLGLAICKKILDHLNGSIEIQSQVNQGTSIKITIPKKVNTL